MHYQQHHVDYLHSIKEDMILWSTEERPYSCENERKKQNNPKNVLPRIVYDGRWKPKSMALRTIIRSLKFSSTVTSLAA